jgi:hypothetical protein
MVSTGQVHPLLWYVSPVWTVIHVPQSGFVGVCAMYCHYLSHGSSIFILTRRKVNPSSTVVTVTEIEVTEDPVCPPSLQQA